MSSAKIFRIARVLAQIYRYFVLCLSRLSLETPIKHELIGQVGLVRPDREYVI